VHQTADGEVSPVLTELQQPERDPQTGFGDGIGGLARSRRFDRLDRGVDAGAVVDVLGVDGEQLEMNRVVGVRYQLHARKRRGARVVIELEHRVALRLDGQQRGDVRRIRARGLVSEVELRLHLRQRRRRVASGESLQAFDHRIRTLKTRGLRDTGDSETCEREPDA
jgi:hypothetical protein